MLGRRERTFFNAFASYGEVYCTERAVRSPRDPSVYWFTSVSGPFVPPSRLLVLRAGGGSTFPRIHVVSETAPQGLQNHPHPC